MFDGALKSRRARTIFWMTKAGAPEVEPNGGALAPPFEAGTEVDLKSL